MLGKFVRFRRDGNDAKGAEGRRDQEIAAPTISLPVRSNREEEEQVDGPLLAYPNKSDAGKTDSVGEMPVFHIDKGGNLPPEGTSVRSDGDQGVPGSMASIDTSSRIEPEDKESESGGDKEKRGLPVSIGARAVGAPRDGASEKENTFVTHANPRLWRSSNRPLSYVGEVTKLNREVFTPTRPKQSLREFVGRRECIEGIVQAIEEERAHVVLFGHKSVGKTSVLNIINGSAAEAGYLVARIMCTADLTFETLIRAIFDDLSAQLAKAPAGAVLEKQLGVERLSDLAEGVINDVPTALRIFERIAGHQVIILLDDFHRIRDAGLKTKIREFMGALSDRGAWVSLVLAGRGDTTTTFEFLDGDAPAGTVMFEIGLMSADEIAEIAEKGGARLGIEFDGDVLAAIVQLSQGLPVVVQWLGLLTARRALRSYAENVTMDDLIEVSDEVSAKVSQKLSGILDRLDANGRSNWAGDLLFLAARTPVREDGVFSTSDMSHEARRAVGRSFSELNLHRVMAQFCDGGDDPILEKIPTSDGIRYRFANPMMRAVIMLRNARRLDLPRSGILGGMSEFGVLPSPETA